MKKSVDISNLRMRETSACKVIDWAMSSACEDPKIRLDASKFVLSRLYSEKHLLEGAGENGEFVLKIEISNEDHSTQEPRHRISKYIEI